MDLSKGEIAVKENSHNKLCINWDLRSTAMEISCTNENELYKISAPDKTK